MTIKEKLWLLKLICYLLGPLLINENISLKAQIDAAIAGSLTYNIESLKLSVGNKQSNETFQDTMQIQFKDHKLQVWDPEMHMYLSSVKRYTMELTQNK